MRSDCHMHMILDGYEWKSAIARHAEKTDDAWIRQQIEGYHALGFTYLRDGGDRWGAGAKAREIAKEYGITYRTPLANLCKAGHPPRVVMVRNVFRHCQVSRGEQRCSWLRVTTVTPPWE